jgi:hypothetical protein
LSASRLSPWSDGFNVDHVLIGPSGVFAIDTKTHSKPAMGDPVATYDGESVLIDREKPKRDPVAQAKAEARFLRAVGGINGRIDQRADYGGGCGSLKE